MTLDVSKCFDSIYTHSMAWATKEKEFIKKNRRSSSFGDDFDVMIRHGNDNETNGIPIGPEISRLFSEIIFQKIDRLAASKLSEDGLEFGVDYVFRRYVDDVYIFGRSEELTKKIYSVYSDNLIKFNLHTNSAKSAIQNRPFASRKSRLIHGASDLANVFFDAFLESTEAGRLTPKPIRSSWRLAKSFIDSVKNLCAHDGVDYDEVSSFMISSITERVKRLINIEENIPDESVRNYFYAAKAILDVVFFLYSVAPSVSASYKLSTTIILLVRFTRSHMKSHEEEISHKIYDLTSQLLLNESQRQRATPVQGFVHLEFINILLAARELGDPYLISESIIEGIFSKTDDFSYFTATSCLFYIRDAEGYRRIRKNLNNYLRRQFLDLSDISTSSEKTHLLFDMLGCPYIPIKLRKKWIKAVATIIGIAAMTPVEIGDIADRMSGEHWQINWSDVDLLNSLEKKELKQAY
ncbi:antiviral reverse transcriptase Drt3b [Alcaligenes faecalis]|uniref:antiviral reverse transcriptase Drt3b n=1 Tax=Alcaligenes faecalis TaxID=511 RepID=UPI0024BC9640|nr:antiviral reverse transcriptase Drt3b [Alcaligenes faecalis]